jgi:hypothetical protein
MLNYNSYCELNEKIKHDHLLMSQKVIDEIYMKSDKYKIVEDFEIFKEYKDKIRMLGHEVEDFFIIKGKEESLLKEVYVAKWKKKTLLGHRYVYYNYIWSRKKPKKMIMSEMTKNQYEEFVRLKVKLNPKESYKSKLKEF